MKFLSLSAALVALSLGVPQPLHAQSAEAETTAKTCVLMGKEFAWGATVRVTGERVRCHRNDTGLFWNRDVDNDENRNSFVLCVYAGEFYSQGAVVDDIYCNGNGNWER
jgi:hypothetical protein